jgi:hypothetical protein
LVLACLVGLALNGYLWRPIIPYFFARANNDFACTYTGRSWPDRPGCLRKTHPTPARGQPAIHDVSMTSVLRGDHLPTAISPLPDSLLGMASGVVDGGAAVSLVLAGAAAVVQGDRLLLESAIGGLPGDGPGRAAAARDSGALTGLVFPRTPRLWRFGAGTLGAGLSYWPLDYTRMRRLPARTPSYGLMPNLNGLPLRDKSSLAQRVAGAILLSPLAFLGYRL